MTVSRFATPLDAFRWLRLPGMELVEPEPAELQRPIGHYCECGRPISANKACCRACRTAEIERVARCITTQEALNAFLGQFPPAMRAGLLEEMRPWLTIQEPETVKA